MGRQGFSYEGTDDEWLLKVRLEGKGVRDNERKLCASYMQCGTRFDCLAGQSKRSLVARVLVVGRSRLVCRHNLARVDLPVYATISASTYIVSRMLPDCVARYRIVLWVSHSHLVLSALTKRLTATVELQESKASAARHTRYQQERSASHDVCYCGLAAPWTLPSRETSTRDIIAASRPFDLQLLLYTHHISITAENGMTKASSCLLNNESLRRVSVLLQLVRCSSLLRRDANDELRGRPLSPCILYKNIYQFHTFNVHRSYDMYCVLCFRSGRRFRISRLSH